MDRNSSQRLGVDSIFSLLIRQGLPASIGILVMSLNILIDTIFVGRWIGSNAIAAINAAGKPAGIALKSAQSVPEDRLSKAISLALARDVAKHRGKT